MKLVLVFAKLVFKILLINLFEVVKVVRALGINALVNNEVLAIFPVNKGMRTMRASKDVVLVKAVLLGERKAILADLAKKLAFLLTVIPHKVRHRSVAGWAGAVFRYIAAVAFVTKDGTYGFVIALLIVGNKILPVPVVLEVLNAWKFVDFELLILGRMGIVESPLLERDVFTDEKDEPAVLLVKILDYFDKIKYNGHEQCLRLVMLVVATYIIPKREVIALFICTS